MENQQPSEHPEQNDQKPQPGELEYHQPLEQDAPIPIEGASDELLHAEHSLSDDQQPVAEDYGLGNDHGVVYSPDNISASTPNQAETEIDTQVEHTASESPTPEESANGADDHWTEFVTEHVHEEPKRTPAEIMKLIRKSDGDNELITAPEASSFIRQCLDGSLVFDFIDEAEKRDHFEDVSDVAKQQGLDAEVFQPIVDEAKLSFEPMAHRKDYASLFISQAIERSEEGIDADIARMLIEEDMGSVVGNNLDKFVGLNAEIADLLITHGESGAVLRYFDLFEELDPNDYLGKLFSDEEMVPEVVDVFVETQLPNLRDLDNNIAVALTEANGAWWLSRLTAEQLTEIFSDLDQMQIAQEILTGNYEYEYITECLSKLTSIDGKNLMDVAIEKKAGYILIANPELFPNVNKDEVLDLMISTGDYYGITDLITDHKFESINSADFAERLVENKMLRVVADNISEFNELHPNIVYDLIHAGYADRVAANIDKFPNLSQQTLRRIIRYTKSEPKK